MMCQGCVGAVTRVLSKMEGACRLARLALRCALTPGVAGVETFDVDLAQQKVTVRGNVTPEAVLDKVSKTGKEPALWT